jgi:hypothetical protein
VWDRPARSDIVLPSQPCASQSAGFRGSGFEINAVHQTVDENAREAVARTDRIAQGRPARQAGATAEMTRFLWVVKMGSPMDGSAALNASFGSRQIIVVVLRMTRLDKRNSTTLPERRAVGIELVDERIGITRNAAPPTSSSRRPEEKTNAEGPGNTRAVGSRASGR